MHCYCVIPESGIGGSNPLPSATGFSMIEITFSDFKLQWTVNNTPLAQKWLQRLDAALSQNIPIDDTKRFYGFGTVEEEQSIALARINHDIEVINSYRPIVERSISDVKDQDTLNYLHHIFEEYHGLLDAQHGEFWDNAPTPVREALARLNVNVHRCENSYRLGEPRAVVTYYGLPKDTLFDDNDYHCIADHVEFGSLYLTYAEIGKTLWDHCIDDDPYIQPDAFKPFAHCSADFNARFYSMGSDVINARREQMWRYYEENEHKFDGVGVHMNDIRSEYGFYPLATLSSDLPHSVILDSLRANQTITEVKIL